MIKIICVGKLKEDYLKSLVKDYQTRINKYHKIEIIEVTDSDIENEAELILKHLKEREYIVTLEILGQTLTSPEFAHSLDKWLMQNANITFIIGGSEGLSDRIKEKTNFALSFSTLTFPHGLFRGILLEQIYRAFKILNNERYHK